MRSARPEVALSPCVRSGFVLPLALFMLTVIALLAALLLEGSVQELRIARGDLAGAHAQATAGSALSDALGSRPDSSILSTPRGFATTAVTVAGGDTTTVTTQSLGNRVLRVTAGSRSWSGGVRADATDVGFVRVVPDSAGPPGSLRYRRLPGWWWAQLP